MSDDAPTEYRRCITCNTRKPTDDMLDQWECQECHDAYIQKQRQRDLTQELANKKKALGQAVNGMVTAMANGKLIPNEPHVVYCAIMEEMGGVEKLAKIFKQEFDELRNMPAAQKSRKVVLDYFKSLFTMGIEAQKTAPPPPNFNDMSDEELGAETARLMQQKLDEMQQQAQQLLLPPPLEPDDLPDAFEEDDGDD